MFSVSFSSVPYLENFLKISPKSLSFYFDNSVLRIIKDNYFYSVILIAPYF